MLNFRTHILTVSFLFFFFFSTFTAVASTSPAVKSQHVRTRKIVGVVTDSVTGERLPFVNVYAQKEKKGTTTDLNGVFTLYLPVGSKIDVTSMGYAPMWKFSNNSVDTLRFFMQTSTTDLNEVVVKPKKQKYSKKNNPAVILMQRVRSDKDKVNPKKEPYYSYDQYDKMIIGLNNYNGYLPGDDGKVKGKFKSIIELVDTAIWTGNRVLDLSMKEKRAVNIFTSDGVERKIVTAQRSNGIDKNLDENYTRTVFEDILQEVDIYKNDLPVMRTRFVSPLAAISADYYKFHIEDTTWIGNDRCVELSFSPHNAESMGFNGKLYIPVSDSVKWVRRVTMRLPKAANVNYVENMFLSQTFNKDSIGRVHKTLDDIIVELHIAGQVGETFMSRQTRYENQSYERRDEFDKYYDKIGSLFVLDDAADKDIDFWNESRLLPLSHAERQLASDQSPFRKLPIIYWTTKVIETLVVGYVKTSKNSKFDFGPIDTFLSHNVTEGWRVSVGGMTTANLNKNLFGRGLVAYGFHDKKWKYKAELEYSFLPKKYHAREFPINCLRASYSYDINHLGQHSLNNAETNLLNSFKRIDSNLSTYQRLGKLEYNIEWMNHMSIKAGLTYQRQESSAFVPFIASDGSTVNSYTQNNFRIEWRYAPNEKFVQTYNERRPINREGLVFTVAHTFGPKGVLGSDFTLNMTELSVQKRFWLSMFGVTDFLLKGGKIWSQVQFPALLWQNANTSYTVQNETFCLLNPMEFALDQYVSLDFRYNMQGLIFNRIPLIKKLGLREIVSFRGFWGSLTKKNNPAYNENLYRFPDADTKEMGKTPYMELGVGVANILTFLRLEYVWRLSYRDTPGAPNSGLRFSFMFAF